MVVDDDSLARTLADDQGGVGQRVTTNDGDDDGCHL